jgi:hypothetical protein
MRKNFYTLIFLFAFLTKSFTQGVIKGKVIDNTSQKPLIFATVTILKTIDTTLVTYRLSDPDGNFRISGLPLHTSLYALVSFTGFDVYRKEFTLAGNNTLDLKSIALQPVSASLDSILVVAERPPVRVYKDTIEFNASSFKTLPTALVEDLLRKLPGVEVDRNGDILVNGKPVNRILVDGKFFFGSDPKMATRNLPANIIDKVQVMEDKEQAERSISGNKNEIGSIINLTLKKGIKKGWFGKTYGGTGTGDRYEIGGIANLYRDTLQLSLIGFSNNINRAGFTVQDVVSLGGFDRSGINSINIANKSGSQGFALNGISFGGLDDGTARSSGAGFNLNHAPDKKFTFYGQYFYGDNYNNIDVLNQTLQYIQDTSIITRTTTNTTRNLVNHSFTVGTNYVPTAWTNVSFTAGGVYNPARSNAFSFIDTDNNLLGHLSRSSGTIGTNQYNGNYTHQLYITLKTKPKEGRIVNVNHSLNYRDGLQRTTTETLNEFFIPADTLPFQQLRRQDIPTLTAITHLNLTEPLSKKWLLRFNNSLQIIKEKLEVSTFDKNEATGQYSTLNYSQSSDFTRSQRQYSSDLILTYISGDLRLGAGLGGLWQNIESFSKIATGFPMTFHSFNWIPNLSISYKALSVQYTKSVTPPSINYLLPVPDNTNPFYVLYGNPYLKPGETHSINVSLFKAYPAKNMNLNFSLTGNRIDNDVILSRIVGNDGVQSLMPVNTNGTTQINGRFNISKNFKNKENFTFSVRFSPYVNYDRRRVIVNNNNSLATNIETGTKFYLGFNCNDIVELRPTYGIAIFKAFYKEATYTNLQVLTQSLETDLLIHGPAKIILQSNVAYRFNSDVAPGLPNKNLLWNAAFSIPVLKDGKGRLQFTVYDILKQNNNFYRYTTENMIVDRSINVLKRYGMLTFTYSFQNIGGTKKTTERGRLFLF